jgi:3-oxoacyl-[acyl-carrier-protein] synthase II
MPEGVAHTRPRVVVTGMGVVSCLGGGREAFWQGLIEGRSGIAPITRFDASGYEANAAGEVKGFDARDWMDFKAARRTGLNVQFGVAAAKQALADSGIEVILVEKQPSIGGLMAQLDKTFPTMDCSI